MRIGDLWTMDGKVKSNSKGVIGSDARLVLDQSFPSVDRTMVLWYIFVP